MKSCHLLKLTRGINVCEVCLLKPGEHRLISAYRWYQLHGFLHLFKRVVYVQKDRNGHVTVTMVTSVPGPPVSASGYSCWKHLHSIEYVHASISWLINSLWLLLGKRIIKNVVHTTFHSLFLLTFVRLLL